MKRTRLSICQRKRRFATRADAMEAALAGGWVLRPYRCDRCGRFHLTSRTKGHHTPAEVAARIGIALLHRAGSSGSD